MTVSFLPVRYRVITKWDDRKNEIFMPASRDKKYENVIAGIFLANQIVRLYLTEDYEKKKVGSEI